MDGRPAPQSTVPRDHLEQVVEATRLVGALIAESLAGVEPPITMPQWRVLVLAYDGGSNVSAVAADLRVHMSNATRICDRLVAAGLLERRRAEHDRRHVLLGLTPAGHALYDAAMAHRRRRIGETMSRMEPAEQAALATALAAFVRAAEAGPDVVGPDVASAE